MTNYTKTTDFAAKDSLPSGDSGKIIRGTEFETEFDNIATAVNSKSDANNPTFTGTVTIDGLTVNGNTVLGNAATDTVTVTADIASNLLPSADDTYNLGAVGAEWNDLFIDGVANIDSLVAGSGSFTSISTTGDVTFGDNDKALFGAGSDLEIYHDSANSLIEDSGTGNLLIRGSDVYIQPSGGGSSMARFTASGAASLYHNGSEKLTTTSTGIDVTGTVVSDGLTVDVTSDSDSVATITSSATANNTVLKLGTSGNDSVISGSGGSTGNLAFKTYGSERMRIDASGNVGINVTSNISGNTKFQVLGSGMAVSDNVTAATAKNSRYFGVSHANQEVTMMYLAASDATSNTLVIGGGTSLAEPATAIAFRTGTAGTKNAGTEAMHISSAGLVGIGTSSPKTQLDIATGTGSAAGPELTLTNGYAALTTGDRVGAINFYTSDASSRGPNNSAVIEAQAATSLGHDANLVFKTGVPASEGQDAVETMRITSNGNVGIGTDSPAALLNTKGNDALLMQTVASDNYGFHVTVAHGTDMVKLGALDSADGSKDGSTITFGNFGRDIRFSTDKGASLSEAMRIDSSQNVLIGTTDENVHVGTTSGAVLRSEGYGFFAVSGNSPIYANRLTDDGAIISLHKEGTPVGSIGSYLGAYTYIGSTGGTDTHISFVNGTVRPATASGAALDATLDLGNSSGRFKDLYLSGGVHLGGTAAANKLDDYEEGTWTPTFVPETGSFTTMTMDVSSATYTKIGDRVVCTGYVRTSNVDTTGASGGLKISGLPFNSGETVACAVTYALDWAGDAPSGGQVNYNSNEVLLNYRTSANSNISLMSVNDLTTGASSGQNRIMFTISYKAI